MAAGQAIQGVLPFESSEASMTQLFERVFRRIKPRTAPPEFSVRFRPYANMDSKIRLEEGHRKISVQISDQLEHAPIEVQESLAHVLLGKLYRKPAPPETVELYRRFANREDVRRRALEIRRKRGRKYIVEPQGAAHDLERLFDRLNTTYFGGEMVKPALGWSPKGSRRLLGHYDPAHHAIVISRLLDDERVPEYVVEYVLYHEMLHLKHPVEYRDQRRCVHSAAFKAEERRFPQYREANRFLRAL